MQLDLSDSTLSVRMTTLEKLATLHGDIAVALDDVVDARVDHEPLRSVRWLKRGLRLPGWMYLCTTDRGRRFWAVRRGEAALVVDLAGPRLRRLTLGAADPESLAARIRSAKA